MRSAAMTGTISLDRGTFHRAIRTKYAAITLFWSKHYMANGTFIKKHTGINRHSFFPGMPALRTGNNGL